jgi:glyoxylase-like metal-dependent hydrolase (beta-lactamase superfamily II)
MKMKSEPPYVGSYAFSGQLPAQLKETCKSRRLRPRHVSPLLLIAVLGFWLGQAPASEATVNLPSQRGPAGPPAYRIYPLPNGVCQIAGNHAFHEGNNAETYDYCLYLWLILGGDKPILVDAGLSNVEEMNRGAAHVLRRPITQAPAQSSQAQLRKFGLKPQDIGHVLITHLHFDHVDDLLTYTNARVYVGRKEWEGATATTPSWGDGRILHEFSNNPQCKARLVLVEDQEVLPGVESFWIGGHTPGSMAYRVNTAHGPAVLTGDTVSLLANFQRRVPPGVFTSLEECRAAWDKIRARADIVLPSHDPGTMDRWPPAPKDAPKYTIRAIKVGECQVRDYISFQDSDSQETSTFYLYIWVIQGGSRPILVETGPKYPEQFSRGTAQYIPGGVKQLPEERTLAALQRHGIDPAQVSHVIATHLHADHYDYFDAFPNARFVVNRREYEENSGQYSGGKDRLAADVRKALIARPDALQLVGDQEVVPGVRVVPLGGHTPGSQGVLVRTHLGPAILTGDVVYKYENLERDRPTRSPDEAACRQAMAKVRSLADIVLPAHDPLTLERWPGGVIGAATGDSR